MYSYNRLDFEPLVTDIFSLFNKKLKIKKISEGIKDKDE